MTNEADLVARIVDDPDDVTAFAVYADWLIEHGDPRGELITLHAQGRDEEATRLLAQHPELVGALPPEVTLEWRHGFAHAAIVHGASAEQLIERLAIVLALPACRFLRKLEVDRAAHEYNAFLLWPVVDWLAAYGKPPTLEHISIADLGSDLPAALLAAYPRFANAKVSWSAIERWIATLPPRESGIDATTLAPLRLKTGEPIPLSAAAVLRGLVEDSRTLGAVDMMSDDDDYRYPMLLRALVARCDPVSLDRFAASLAVHAFAPAPLAWAPASIAHLGGPYTARMLGSVRPSGDLREWERCLRHTNTPLAWLELLASNADRAFPQPAFAGRASLDRVGGEPLLLVPWGRVLARAGADPLAELDSELAARFAALDIRAIEHLIATGWTTTLAEAIELFVTAPRAPRAAGLVWGRRRAGTPSLFRRVLDIRADDETEPFWLTADGGTDAHGRALAIDPAEPIWLAHPGELLDDELATWRGLQRARRPQVTQLERWLPLPRTRLGNRTGLVRSLLDPFPTRAALSACGYSDAPVPTYGTGPTVAKTYRYRDDMHRLTIDLGTRVIHHHRDLPLVVLHELARELVSASRDRR